MKDLDRKVPWSQELESVWAEKDPEDEAFEQLALRQGQWDYSGQNTSGWRKKQVYGLLFFCTNELERLNDYILMSLAEANKTIAEAMNEMRTELEAS